MTILSIIILNYKTKDFTTSCINSIYKIYRDELGKKNIEIIVVDNGSDDDSVKEISKLKKKIPNLKVIKNEKNMGFSGGNNLGAKQVSGKYVLFLNSDTQILDKGLIGMTDFLEKNDRAGILGGKLKNTDGTNQDSTGKFFDLINVFLMLFGGEKLLRTSPDRETKVDWVSGASLMIRSDLFRKLGGFDENFFMYIEDMDLCLRAKKIGYLTYFYSKIKIFHDEQGSSNRSFAIINIYKGIIYFYKKHKGYLEYYIARVFLIFKALIAIFIGLLTQDKYLLNTYKTAIKFSL
ncbi:MAG: glycosyltransferase family 2 protein [Patescibacteria group bacterium]|nr:glycosyltransferase family 2 protein [Patescibacteria group bacterium]